jgi:hypothetical protein
MEISNEPNNPSSAPSIEFPPPQIRDLDKKSAGNYLSLLRRLVSRPISLILGSGTSATVGIPIWKKLLTQICASFFCHWEFGIQRHSQSLELPPHQLSIVFTEDFFWSNEVKDVAEYFSNSDPLLVAQQIKNCIRPIDWRYLLQKVLYPEANGNPQWIKNSDLLTNLALLSKDSSSLISVINYNYDNSFQIHLQRLGIPCCVLWEGKNVDYKGRLPIFHPHGYLPLGGGPLTKIVLAESDYHHEAANPYSWANIIQTRAFSGSTCIFFGTSMIDPNLRRLLRISKVCSSERHYAFLPRDPIRDQKQVMSQALFDYDLSQLGVRVIRFPRSQGSQNPYSRLGKLVEFMVAYAQGKRTIWS